jgi:hypothetical protein
MIQKLTILEDQGRVSTWPARRALAPVLGVLAGVGLGLPGYRDL